MFKVPFSNPKFGFKEFNTLREAKVWGLSGLGQTLAVRNDCHIVSKSLSISLVDEFGRTVEQVQIEEIS